MPESRSLAQLRRSLWRTGATARGQRAGQVAVTRTLLPRLIDARGRIVMMSSIGGLVAGPLFGPNSASKFAIEAFTDVLRREVGPLGVRVVAIEPGAIATPIWERGGSPRRPFGGGRARGPASVRPAGRRGPRARRPRLAGRAAGRGRGDGGRPGPDRATASHPVPGRRDAVAQAWLNRLLPDRAMDALVRRAVFGSDHRGRSTSPHRERIIQRDLSTEE